MSPPPSFLPPLFQKIYWKYGLKLNQYCINLQSACQVSILEYDNNTENYYNYNGEECPNTTGFDKFLFFFKFYQLYPIYKIQNSKIIN